ncbi:MAG: methyltransferase domain-containing protein [Kofleriaceae bacterium]
MPIVAAIPALCARGSRALDLGTGGGRHAVFLAQQGYEVDAIDASADAVMRLRAWAIARRLAIRAELRDVGCPDIAFSRYRIVVCTFVLHFLPRDRALDLLERARAQAAPGTVHAIAVITTQGEFYEASLSRGQFYYPEPGELAAQYRAWGWRIHHESAARRDSYEKRADGSAMRNVVSFTLAGV